MSIAMAAVCAAAPVRRAPSKPASPSTPPIATIAGRRVEEADIRRAAVVMSSDPARVGQHSLWRKKLLDLCVDRELLALEAERQGLLNDRLVRRDVDRRGAQILYGAIRDRVLIPEVTPTAAQIDSARESGLYRRVKLSYVLSVTDKKATYDVMQAIKHGASFDSIATLYSVHPSARHGGEIGWKLVRELNKDSWKEFNGAKPGDLLGPYVNGVSHEFYRLEAITDPTDRDIRDVMMRDRTLDLDLHYSTRLLQRYRFAMNPEAVSSVIFAAGTEKADSIVASLDPDGTRPKRGIHPALAVLARVDGDSLTYRDLALSGVLERDESGMERIAGTKELIAACMAAMTPRLIERDARERGFDRDPAIARELRLVREEMSTRMMVERSVPALDSAAIRAYFHSHASRYRRPAARTAQIAMFADSDSASMARAGWTRPAFRDSILLVEGFRALNGGVVGTLFPRFQGEVPVFDRDHDPISDTVRRLAPGEVSPVIPTARGYAVARAIGSEPERPFTFDEVRFGAGVDAREDVENAWVERLLTRLRASTPARTVPARLDAVRLGMTDTGGDP